MLRSLRQSPFSSRVSLSLVANGVSRPLARTGPDRLTLETPADLPPGEATVVTAIDGRVHTRQVLLPDGASADSPFVRVKSLIATALNA